MGPLAVAACYNLCIAVLIVLVRHLFNAVLTIPREQDIQAGHMSFELLYFDKMKANQQVLVIDNDIGR